MRIQTFPGYPISLSLVLLCAHPPTQATHTSRLTYEPNPNIYLNPHVTQDYTLLHPTTGQKLTLRIQGKGFNNAIAAAPAPQGHGIFVTFKTFLAHFSTYQEKPPHTLNILDDQPKTLLYSKAGTSSMPIFSPNGQHAVIYQHYPSQHNKIHKNYLHFSLDTNTPHPLYKPTLQTPHQDYDALLLGPVQPNTQPLLHAALSNQGQLVTLTGYQDPTQPKQLACGQWTQGTPVMTPQHHHIQPVNQPWLKHLVHITCLEHNENPTFQFWVLPHHHTNGTTTFGPLHLYNISWSQLLQGTLPNTKQAPNNTIPLHLDTLTNATHIIRLQPTHTTPAHTTYTLTYLTQDHQTNVTTIIHPPSPPPTPPPPITTNTKTSPKPQPQPDNKYPSHYLILVFGATIVVWIPYKLRQPTPPPTKTSSPSPSSSTPQPSDLPPVPAAKPPKEKTIKATH